MLKRASGVGFVAVRDLVVVHGYTPMHTDKPAALSGGYSAPEAPLSLQPARHLLQLQLQLLHML